MKVVLPQPLGPTMVTNSTIVNFKINLVQRQSDPPVLG